MSLLNRTIKSFSDSNSPFCLNHGRLSTDCTKDILIDMLLLLFGNSQMPDRAVQPHISMCSALLIPLVCFAMPACPYTHNLWYFFPCHPAQRHISSGSTLAPEPSLLHIGAMCERTKVVYTPIVTLPIRTFPHLTF